MPQNTINPASAYLRSHAGRVCVAIQAASIGELLDRAKAALPDSHFLEFRLDSLPAIAPSDLDPVRAFLAAHKDTAVIATCRRKPHGGSFLGTLQEELAMLTAAADCGFAFLDLTIESAEECSPAQFRALSEAASAHDSALILSYHDFHSASDPQAAFARIQRFSPDFIKIVNTAHKLSDSLNLLRWIMENSGHAQIVGIAMGEPGIVSRVLSLRAGSSFTFASAADGLIGRCASGEPGRFRPPQRRD